MDLFYGGDFARTQRQQLSVLENIGTAIYEILLDVRSQLGFPDGTNTIYTALTAIKTSTDAVTTAVNSMNTAVVGAINNGNTIAGNIYTQTSLIRGTVQNLSFDGDLLQVELRPNAGTITDPLIVVGP